MPLVRVSGRDAESFDTFDVAEMADDRSDQRSWASRRTLGATSWYGRQTLSPTPEADDLASIDSSSGGRRSEEASDRVGSIPSSSSRGGAGGSGRDGNIPRLSQSSHSVSSMNSYHSASLSGSGYSADNNMRNSYSSYASNSYSSAGVPLYDTVDNLDEMQHDPRNPFNNNKNQETVRDGCWGDHISEEDETSVASTEDSSVTPSQQSSQYAQPMHQRQQPAHRSRRQRQSHDADDVSVASHQSSRESSRRNSVNNNDNSSQLIQQLESQVLKINFELATTKSSLDELQLENRRLADDKEKLSTDVRLLQEENEQLHLKIERMEREMILRNMEGTKGVVAPASSCQAYVPVTKQRLGKVNDAGGGGGGGSLEVPFRSSSSNDFHLRPKQRGSVRSHSSLNELHSDDEGASRGEADCRSVALSDCEADLRNSQSSSDYLEDAAAAQRGGRGMNIMDVFGGKKPASVREITERVKEVSLSFPSRRSGEGESESDKCSPRSLTSHPRQEESRSVRGEADSDDIGSNPQGEGEDFNDDDPFSTWSAPGDPKRKEPEQNWLQRGLGGGGGREMASVGGGGDVKCSSRRQSNEEEEGTQDDPFDSCGDRYTSFPTSASERSEDGGDGQDRKRFGLFKGFMGRGRRQNE